MNKQAAYARLRELIDVANAALDVARKFADENELVMSHKENGLISAKASAKQYGDDFDEDNYYDESPNVEQLLTVRTLTEKETATESRMLNAESGFDYCWLPSSMRC